MLAEENGPFLTAKDPQALAGSLQALLADPALRKSVGKANQRVAREKFTFQTMARAYDALFRGAV
jgi:glycosyltransferase involved in cell wall biosynthesis